MYKETGEVNNYKKYEDVKLKNLIGTISPIKNRLKPNNDENPFNNLDEMKRSLAINQYDNYSFSSKDKQQDIIKCLQETVETHSNDIESLKNQVSNIEGKVNGIEQKVNNIEGKVNSMEGKVDSIKSQFSLFNANFQLIINHFGLQNVINKQPKNNEPNQNDANQDN